MFKELQKIAKENENTIRVATCEKTLKSYAYIFINNTVVYYILDDEIDAYNDVIIPNISSFDNIEDAIHSDNAIFDETPFDFYQNETENNHSIVSKNNFVKTISPFYKFCDENNIRNEYRGIHINNGKIIATNGYIMRMVDSTIFDKNINIVVDFKPILDYININPTKIKNVGKPLWNNSKSQKDSVKIITPSNGDYIHFEYNGLIFINHVFCKSQLDFTHIRKASDNLDISLKIYKQDLYKSINNILSNSTNEHKYIKNVLVFEQVNNKLMIYPYNKFNDDIGNNVEYVNIHSDLSKKLVINGLYLMNILKDITVDILEIHINSKSNISKIQSNKLKEEYYLIFNK